MNDAVPATKPTLGKATGLNRSCEACRARKIRCFPLISPGTLMCTRCAQRGISCIFLPPTSRRRRRVDARIQELERKIEALLPTAGSISAHENETPTVSSLSVTPQSTLNAAGPCSIRARDAQAHGDPIESGLLSMPKATELYEFFSQELMPHYPAVFVLPSVDAEHMRRANPSLFLSIITAAAASLDPDIAPILNTELEQSHARSVMVDGEKSLNLAEALLVSAIWNYPPNRFDSLKFGRYAQMATDIVLDLDLPRELDRQLSSSGEPTKSTSDGSSSQYELVEKCRTLVACFLLSSSIALSFRRSSTIPFTPVIGKCIAYLKYSLHSVPQDRRLALWAELQRRAENVSAALAANNPSQQATPECEFRLADTIAGLSVWMNSIDQQCVNKSMMIHYHYIRMNAHEQALHYDHQMEDFKPPYILRCSLVHTETTLKPDHNTLAALNACLCAGHLLLETFLGMTISDLRTVPVVVYTRMFYAVVVFAKLYASTQSLDSQFQGLINAQSISFDSYLWRLIVALQAARGTQNFRVPKIFLGMLEQISGWCINRLQSQLEDPSFDDSGEEWEPMKYTDTADITLGTPSIGHVDASANYGLWTTNFDSILSFLDE